MVALEEESMNFEVAVHSVEDTMSAISSPEGPTMSQTTDNGAAPQSGDFRCGICNKTYSRRDLRDRHRRRCIKTAGQERLSKRKSCETCAQKKLRCSMTRPACARCVQMGTACHYPPTSLPPRIADPQDTPPTSSASVASSRSGQSTHSSNAMGRNMVTDTSSAMALDDVPHSGTNGTHPLPAPGHPCNPTPNHFDPMSATGWNPFGTTNMDSMVRALDGSLFSPSGSLSWGDDFTPLTDPMSVGNTFAGAMDESTNPGSSYFLPLHEISKPVGSLEAPQQGALAANSYNPNSPYNVPSLSSSSSDSHYRDGSSRGEENDATQGLLRGDHSPRLTLGYHFIPKVGPFAMRDYDEAYRDLFSVFREYPGMILEREFWSPFVHHRLYRCSMGGMAEPMGIALACVSAHASSVESSYGFVDRMINEERDKLVRNFHKHVDTPETCLAAVHAVCLYQILGFFGDNFLPAAIVRPQIPKEINDKRREENERAAELHSSFLLKMARRLYKMHQEKLLTHHNDENDWNRWKYAESLRRNFFFVNMINILGARARLLNEQYFEPLGDDIVLQLPLPAPEHMWRCCDEEEWAMAREHALQRPGNSPPAPRTLRELLEQDKAGALDTSTLLPITRLIFACAKVAPKGDLLGDL
ncbi:hypothetical protein BDV37DRAFT_172371 [Aspergillus pseudonomiae]|uniref:Uncharacterized protein n=1 Tax=Aspergillus pseudonomiae TaxID=1506151 RepID=A0A5N7DSF1_9EURO|nr:uncharacterized protein BDV37DRAFT_172371 [Aspergillus pseudonomiae]KAE8408438.1 hypothetical protein BDV37DRAFT_172371 [Aspergillus pseudonomiae]